MALDFSTSFQRSASYGAAREIGRARLAETFAPFFTLILQLRASNNLGSPDTLRDRIKQMLVRVERDARSAGASGEDIRLAKFAVIAFIDEAVMASEWRGREQWLASPLQLELFDRHDAGEHFFVELEELRAQGPARAEVLEVYYLCMTLGFKGKYRIFEQERLRVLIDDVFEELAHAPGFVAQNLSPHGKARQHVVSEARGKLPTWVIVAAAIAVAVAVYLVFTGLISAEAGEVERTVLRL